jgi:hypothetical protein
MILTTGLVFIQYKWMKNILRSKFGVGTPGKQVVDDRKAKNKMGAVSRAACTCGNSLSSANHPQIKLLSITMLMKREEKA